MNCSIAPLWGMLVTLTALITRLQNKLLHLTMRWLASGHPHNIWNHLKAMRDSYGDYCFQRTVRSRVMASDEWESDGEFEASVLQMDVKSEDRGLEDLISETHTNDRNRVSAVSVFPKAKVEPTIPNCSTPQNPQTSRQTDIQAGESAFA